MRISSALAIRLLWCLALVGAVVGAKTQPPFPEQVSPAMAVTAALMPILFFPATAFWVIPRSPFYHPRLAEFVDRRFGPGTLASFLVRLKPLLMFGVAAIVQGLVGLIQVSRGAASLGAYLPSVFFSSAGLGFCLAHWILYKRKAVGVFSEPSGANSPQVEVPPAPVRGPLGRALRLYWWSLIGIALFPSVAFIGGDVLHIAFEYFVLPFFAVTFLAAWPWFSGRAPYSFWLVALVVYMLGGLFAVLLVQVARAATV
jgi:hypothetical protein